MKITFTPGSESLDRMSRVPSVDPSSQTSTSSVRPVFDRDDFVEQPFDRRPLVVDRDEHAEGGRHAEGSYKLQVPSAKFKVGGMAARTVDRATPNFELVNL